MYCDFAKNQAFSLVFRVSSGPRCLKPSQKLEPQSFSSGFYGKRSGPINNLTLQRSNFSFAILQKPTREDNISIRSKPRICFHLFRFNNTVPSAFIGNRSFFSNASPQKQWHKDSESRIPRKNLPWIASAYKNKEAKVAHKLVNEKNSRSSWEESANKFFIEKGIREPAGRTSDSDKSDSIRSYKSSTIEKDENREEVEMEEEIIDDPRWDKIKTKFGRSRGIEFGGERPEVRRWNKEENWGRKTWKEATDVSTIPKMMGEAVYGVGPVLAALSAGRREFYALYVQEGLDLSSNNRKKKDKKGFEKVLRISEKLGLTAKETSKHDLNMVVDNRPHQGLVLDASPLEMVNIRELDAVSMEEENGPLWVALDEVTDPQNLGAIIRSAYFFGAAGVVLCAKNSAPLSGVVSKASAGSLELMELRSCKNMMQFLSSSVDNGWRVLGGSVSSRALSLKEVSAGAPTILVLGSEGTGLRPLVERSCTELIRIPGNIPVYLTSGGSEGEEGKRVDHGSLSQEFRSFLAVESLNVSVAAGVLLHHLMGNSNNCQSGDKQEKLG